MSIGTEIETLRKNVVAQGEDPLNYVLFVPLSKSIELFDECRLQEGHTNYGFHLAISMDILSRPIVVHESEWERFLCNTASHLINSRVGDKCLDCLPSFGIELTDEERKLAKAGVLQL